jgi:hypothetical protein
MPTPQEVDQVKENIKDLRVFLNSIYTEGTSVISSVFASLDKTDDTDLGLQITINLYTNALVTINSVVSNYSAASIAGYKDLTPENLSGPFINVADCFQKTYLQADSYLNSIETNVEAYWYNTCTGQIYFPSYNYILSVILSELASTQFIKNTDANYTEKVNLSLAALDVSLRNALQ